MNGIRYPTIIGFLSFFFFPFLFVRLPDCPTLFVGLPSPLFPRSFLEFWPSSLTSGANDVWCLRHRSPSPFFPPPLNLFLVQDKAIEFFPHVSPNSILIPDRIYSLYLFGRALFSSRRPLAPEAERPALVHAVTPPPTLNTPRSSKHPSFQTRLPIIFRFPSRTLSTNSTVRNYLDFVAASYTD